ncbi:hypothetical protein K435DRAFT_959790 [Dendrothele bispora CBS 962.96]|uniref:ditrans,polycis-polyprenyl diphosphate synthase [(2E,6E)-farnesyldiphosphate specific] n=1 Tax=Dendrothele bispora (strain CBS 962.96) TaxID=1314807 RepID=A0A4S8MWL8_DENBC|nr:hypothetical protein K435DRAFT_959790 [Dendrothele bispora CBS 962.96]
MGLLAYPFLLVLHFLYSLTVLVLSVWRRLRQFPPLPLKASRQRIPRHLAILFVTDSEIDLSTTEQRLLESVDRSVKWCQAVGIEQLTLYDSDGILLRCSESIRKFVVSSPIQKKELEPVNPVINYPPTPPLSDYSESRSLSPEGFGASFPGVKITALSAPKKQSKQHKRRLASNKDDLKTLNINIVSRDASKPFLAEMARSLAWSERRKQKIDSGPSTFRLTVPVLEQHLEGPNGLSAPDFMIVHPVHPSKYNRLPMELHGFPPWQIRLTEIYCNRLRKKYRSRLMWFLPLEIRSAVLSSSLTEWEFREALDQYAGAEIRLGR